MKLLVFSHKEVWRSSDSPTGWATDGGFTFHMMALGSLFDEVELIVPEIERRIHGEVAFKDPKLTVSAFKYLSKAQSLKRKVLVLFWGVKNLRYLHNKIKQADVVHTPIPSDFGTLGMLLTKLMGKPLFIRHCGNWLIQNTFMERFWKNFMIKYTGNNTVTLATGGGMEPPSDQNLYIKWIFSTSLLDKDLIHLAEQATEKKSSQIFRVVSVSRQVHKKGTATTLHALALLNNKDIHFDVVGDGKDLNSFKEVAKELGLEGQVTFHGKLSNKGVLNVLLQADLFCFPTQASEGFPKVVMEAMACGLPVITNPVSVLPLLITPTNSGKILSDSSPETLASALKSFIQHPEMLEACGANALTLAKQYSLERWADFIAKELSNNFGINIYRKRELSK